MKDEFLDIGRSAIDRFTNPIVTSFLASWVIINWDVLLMLCFANYDIIRKIELIKTDYYSIYNYYIFPILGTLIFIFVGPRLVQQINKINSKFQSKRESFEAAQKVKNMINSSILSTNGNPDELIKLYLEDIKKIYFTSRSLFKKIEELEEKAKLIIAYLKIPSAMAVESNDVQDLSKMMLDRKYFGSDRGFEEINKKYKAVSSIVGILEHSSNDHDEIIKEFDNILEDFEQSIDGLNYKRQVSIFMYKYFQERFDEFKVMLPGDVDLFFTVSSEGEVAS